MLSARSEVAAQWDSRADMRIMGLINLYFGLEEFAKQASKSKNGEQWSYQEKPQKKNTLVRLLPTLCLQSQLSILSYRLDSCEPQTVECKCATLIPQERVKQSWSHPQRMHHYEWIQLPQEPKALHSNALFSPSRVNRARTNILSSHAHANEEASRRQQSWWRVMQAPFCMLRHSMWRHRIAVGQ